MDEPGRPKRGRQMSIFEAFATVEKSRRLDASSDLGFQRTNSQTGMSTTVNSNTRQADEQQKYQSDECMPILVVDSTHSPTVSEIEYGSPDTDETIVIDSDETIITSPRPDSEDELESSSCSLGVPITELPRTPQCSPPLPALEPSFNHTILFKVGADFGMPWPETYVDKWDQDHVRMPCSPQSLYPVLNEATGDKKLQRRWKLIIQALNGSIKSSVDLENAILSYNTRYKDRWNFDSLHRLFTQFEERESREFFEKTLPQVVQLALRLPQLVTGPVPLLKQGRTHTITMSQMQAASLLANAFFCTFPRRNAFGKDSEYKDYPHINFAELFNERRGASNAFGRRATTGNSDRQLEKLKSLLNYFKRVIKNEPRGTLSFRRQHLTDFPCWKDSQRQLPRLHVTSHGTIEDDGEGMLQVDFANMYVGGGVLKHGCVQEEIRFVICPEMIVSMLFAEKMTNSECVIMTGCERFSSYTGYGNSFKWSSDFVDTTPCDSWGRKLVDVVAIDAKPFRQSRVVQYSPECFVRELNKAYCGFSCPGVRSRSDLAAVATGNWGCGAFNGDPRFKAVLQMMAAAEAGRDMVYFTFGDIQLCRDIDAVHRFLRRDKCATVGSVFSGLVDYRSMVKGSKAPDLYQFLRDRMAQYDSDTDVETAAAAAFV